MNVAMVDGIVYSIMAMGGIGVIIFGIYIFHDRSHPFVGTFREVTSGGVIIRPKVLGRVIRYNTIGEVLYWPRLKILTPNFSNITQAPVFGSRKKHLDITVKDGFFYANQIKKYREFPDEFKKQMAAKYSVIMYEEGQDLINPLPNSNRQFWFKAMEQLMQRTSTRNDMLKILLAIGFASIIVISGALSGYLLAKQQLDTAQLQAADMLAKAPQCTQIIEATKKDLITSVGNILQTGKVAG